MYLLIAFQVSKAVNFLAKLRKLKSYVVLELKFRKKKKKNWKFQHIFTTTWEIYRTHKQKVASH